MCVQAMCSADGCVRIYEAPDVMNLSQWTLQHEIPSGLSCSCLSWNLSRSVVSLETELDQSEIIENADLFVCVD